LEGGRYILGEEVESFEAPFADFVGVAHAVGRASGTDAIELALRAVSVILCSRYRIGQSQPSRQSNGPVRWLC
jgi:dTDP-4-amino-4,6-dideoxygalactose transaminase